jgi:glycosyltransferase involved in cell wall biosynthesis
MKITFLAPHIKIAGGTRAFLTYADLLAKKGHKVVVIVPMPNFLKRMAGNMLRRKPTWFKNFDARIKWVPDYNEKYIPDGDVVIATAWQTAESVASYDAAKGKKFYLIQHYESLYHGAPEKVDATYRLPLHKIVISTWLKGIMKEKFNSDSDLIVTPVDFELFHYVEGVRKKEPIKILLLGHNAKWKGTEEGIRAFELAKQKYNDIELVTFGLKGRANATVEGSDQASLAKMYSSCHIYLCPSEYEGLGMPSMEAMACKCALVTYDNGGSNDYAMDGQTAFVAKHADFDDLLAKLELAISDSNLREEIAEKGQKFIRNNFSWERAAEKMESIFKTQ